MGEGGFEPPTKTEVNTIESPTRPPAEYHTKLDHPPNIRWDTNLKV
jgi:hypothetical protein